MSQISHQLPIDNMTEKDKISPQPEAAPSMYEGQVKVLDDQENRDFYGGSITDSYRLKSELVSACLEEIGMGRSVSTLVLYHDRKALQTNQIPIIDTNGNSLW